MERGDLDLFEGSPPCASFSAAGLGEKAWGKTKKYSDKEQRTDDLFWEWMRLLDGLYPRAFVAENVPGMLTGNALEEYAWKITEELAGLGYRVNARVMDSQNFGVPQERKRLIFLGVRRDLLDEPPRHPDPTVSEPFTLGQALEAAGPQDPEVVAASSMEGKAVGRTWHYVQECRAAGREVDFRYLPCQRCGKSPLKDHTILKQTKDGLVTKATCADGEKAEILKDYFMLTIPRLEEPCPTVTATGAQVGAASVVHPTECRKFTPGELRAICGFPEDFVLTGTREQQCERMGRTVTPPLYKAVGRTLADYLIPDVTD
jgi:DNA (cytosine-5)-methyltransferase 1